MRNKTGGRKKMIDFDEKKIIEKADKLYALRGELEAVADKV